MQLVLFFIEPLSFRKGLVLFNGKFMETWIKVNLSRVAYFWSKQEQGTVSLHICEIRTKTRIIPLKACPGGFK